METRDKKRNTYAIIATGGVLLLGAVILTLLYKNESPSWQGSTLTAGGSFAATRIRPEDLHIIIPASNPDINLCKNLLSLHILQYPTPTLIAWQRAFHDGAELGGGSHLAKISDSLQFLEQKVANDRDMVLMVDGLDVWFQLAPEILLSRYQNIVQDSNQRLRTRIGKKVVENDALSDSIIFGAGKRCAPNQPHTVACYAAPPSPVRSDLYGGNTDTIMGWNKYSSSRQRYLNSGLIMGPSANMRTLFRSAEMLMEEHHGDESMVEEGENGSGGSIDFYHGSDQSIFTTLLGRQEYAREWARKQHATTGKTARMFSGGYTPRSSRMEGTEIDDILNPSFDHQVFDPTSQAPGAWEHGITLDYFSDLIHQTVNSERDARYLKYSEDLNDQVSKKTSMFECEARLPALDGSDIISAENSSGILGPVDWHQMPLYTHICLSRIPVIVHHNGEKFRRDTDWDRFWMFPFLRQLQQSVTGAASGENDKGALVATTSDDVPLHWRDICPSEWDDGIFGRE